MMFQQKAADGNARWRGASLTRSDNATGDSQAVIGERRERHGGRRVGSGRLVIRIDLVVIDIVTVSPFLTFPLAIAITVAFALIARFNQR